MAHTPGPWTLHRKYPSARIVAGEFEFLQTNGRGDNPDVWLANARLVAAAPELLDALKQLMKAYESVLPGLAKIAVQDYALINDAPVAAERAILKAEGRS